MTQRPTIPAAQAAALMGISVKTVLKRLSRYELHGYPEPLSSTNSAETYQICVDSLPLKAQEKYYWMQMARQNQYLTDLISPCETYGYKWLYKHTEALALTRKIVQIQQEYRSDGRIKEQMRLLAGEYGISVSALYRFQQRMTSSECAKLIPANEIYMEYSPKTMCLLCCDLVFYLWLSKDKNYQQTDILRECQSHAESTHCADCIYRENSAVRKQWEKENIQFALPVCRLHREHMQAPNNRFAIRRLLQRMPEQQRCFCREGVRTWQKKYGHFLTRKKPDMVNSLWMGDHHQCQCFVRITERHSTHEKPQEREILVRPYLTVWLDVASGYIVGWVISVMPNSSTIAEAFCRAAVYTVGDVAHGLPVRVMTDCGKDYRSKMLTQSVEGEFLETDYQNRLFSGNGLFPALNIKVMKNAPYHPMSKSPVEVLFGILERRFFSKLPGWCRESAQKRPYDFQKRLDRQWKNGELFSLEEFVDYFRNKVLPEYHHDINMQEDTNETVMRECSDPDPSQWHTPLSAMSPYEKYISLPKERDLTPTWRSMALFQMYRKDGCSVTNQGIRFRHIDYWHSALADVIGSERNAVSILYNAGSAQSDVPLSLTVIYQGKFLCEAYPADVFPNYDASTEKLAAFHDENRAHRNKLRQNYERIAKAVRLTGLTCNDEISREMWGASIDEEKDAAQGVNLTQQSFEVEAENTHSASDYQRAIQILYQGGGRT